MRQSPGMEIASKARLAFTPLTLFPINPLMPVLKVSMAIPATVWSACRVMVRNAKISPRTAPTRTTVSMARPRFF